MSFIFHHRCHICRWAGGSGSAAKLISASYDGTVRSLDLGQGVFEAVVLSDNNEWSAMDCTSDGNCVYVADKDGDITAIDTRSHEAIVKEFSLHDKKVNTLQVSLYLAACLNGSLLYWILKAIDPGSLMMCISARQQ